MTSDNLAFILKAHKNYKKWQPAIDTLIYDFGQAIRRWHKTENSELFAGVPYVEVIRYQDEKNYTPITKQEAEWAAFLKGALQVEKTKDEEQVQDTNWQSKLIQRFYKTKNPGITCLELIDCKTKNLVMFRLLYKPK